MITRFLKDTSYSFLGQFVSAAFTFVGTIVTARILGADGQGVLAMVILLPATLNALISSGFSATVVHSIAAGKWSDHDLPRRMLGIWVYLSAFMLFAGLIAVYLQPRLFPNVPLNLLFTSLPLVAINLLNGCLLGILAGKRQFFISMQVKCLGAATGFLQILLFVWVLNFGPTGALWAQILNGVLITALLVRTIHRNNKTLRMIQTPDFRWKSLKDSLSFGGKAHLANLSSFLNYKFDQFLVNGFLGSASVGIYIVAVNHAEILWMLMSQFAAVIFPMSSEPQKDAEKIARFTAKLAAVSLCLMTLFGIALSAIATPLVSLLFGQDFREAGLIIILLMPGIIALGHTKITASYIAGRGHPGLNALGSTGALVINISTNLILIPKLGIVGAAIATSLSYTFASLFAYVNFIKISKNAWTAGLIPSASDLANIYRRMFHNTQYRSPSA